MQHITCRTYSHWSSLSLALSGFRFRLCLVISRLAIGLIQNNCSLNSLLTEYLIFEWREVAPPR